MAWFCPPMLCCFGTAMEMSGWLGETFWALQRWREAEGQGSIWCPWKPRKILSVATRSTGELTCGWCGGLVPSCLTRVTPWSVARQAPLSMGFPRQGYWSGLPFPSPGDLPDPGIEHRSLALQVISCIAGGFFTNWAIMWLVGVLYLFSHFRKNQQSLLKLTT